jgi:hypothetical protein
MASHFERELPSMPESGEKQSEHSWPNPKSPHGLSTSQKNWARQIAELVAIYSSPIILASSKDKSVYHNASGFLLKPTPAGKTLLVTNSHVMEDGFRAIEKASGGALFTFGGVTFRPDVIDENGAHSIDLAIIDVTRIDFVKAAPGYWESSAAKLHVWAATEWPTSAPRKGDATATVGWPIDFRVHEDGHTEFAAFPMLGHFVDDVGRTSFTIPFDQEGMIAGDFDPANDVITKRPLYGFSGSPVFAMHREGLNPLVLIGIVRRYGENFDILHCTRADIIRGDGTVDATGD